MLINVFHSNKKRQKNIEGKTEILLFFLKKEISLKFIKKNFNYAYNFYVSLTLEIASAKAAALRFRWEAARMARISPKQAWPRKCSRAGCALRSGTNRWCATRYL